MTHNTQCDLSSYNAATSSGSNLGPTNPAFVNDIRARIGDLKATDPLNTQSVPVDLVTSSGSGLDPHISLASALYQIPRVARARRMSEDMIHTLVERYTERRQFGFLGEPSVNVLLLNLALDGIKY
jgi:K+-transporting ATPase ATPase C chain